MKLVIKNHKTKRFLSSNMLRELYGYDNIIQRRLSLEEKLNLR